jgi:hypothetical protein
MFIDTTKVITNIDGEKLKLQAKEPGAQPEDLTLGYVIVEALLTDYPNENLKPGAKIDRMDMAEKYHKVTLPVETKNDDAGLIKDLIAKRWGIIVTAQACRLIDKSPSKLEPVPVPQAAE